MLLGNVEMWTLKPGAPYSSHLGGRKEDIEGNGSGPGCKPAHLYLYFCYRIPEKRRTEESLETNCRMRQCACFLAHPVGKRPTLYWIPQIHDCHSFSVAWDFETAGGWGNMLWSCIQNNPSNLAWMTIRVRALKCGAPVSNRRLNLVE